MNISYFDGLNEKLFNAIPKNAERILELGCANGLLGEAYKIVNPYSHWTGIDINPEAIEIAKNKLDVVKKIDLNQNRLIDFLDVNTYDVIVIGDLLEHMINPEEIINDIHKVGVHNAQIIMCIPNMCSMQVIEKMILGDLTYDDMGLLDKTHLRFFSQPSIFKLILDCGFLPELIDSYNIQLSDSKFLQHIIQAASSLGMPNQTFINNLQRYQLIIRAFKNEKYEKRFKNDNGLSVIVPVTSEQQFNENIMKSPGLNEINAEIIKIYNATSAADAFTKGKAIAKYEWMLFVHQDVYIPKGQGNNIVNNLDKIKEASVVGFAGLEIDTGNFIKKSGYVVDRTNFFNNHNGFGSVISLDEFAIIINKNSMVEIDPALGWHTWATDLCLQAYLRDDVKNAVIIAAVLFHNSWNDYVLDESYIESAKILKNKYPLINRIETLCGTIS